MTPDVSVARRIVLQCLSAVVFFGASNLYASVELHLIARTKTTHPIEGRVILRAKVQNAEQQAIVREVAVHGDAVTLDEAPGSRWDVSLDAPGYWAPPAVIEFPVTGTTRIDLPVWATTTLHGRLRFPEKDTTAKALTVGIESPPHPTAHPEIARGTTFPCSLAADAAWTCTVPATSLDLVFRVDGFAPVYRWGMSLQPDVPRELGELRLQTAASPSPARLRARFTWR